MPREGYGPNEGQRQPSVNKDGTPRKLRGPRGRGGYEIRTKIECYTPEERGRLAEEERAELADNGWSTNPNLAPLDRPVWVKSKAYGSKPFLAQHSIFGWFLAVSPSIRRTSNLKPIDYRKRVFIAEIANWRLP